MKNTRTICNNFIIAPKHSGTEHLPALVVTLAWERFLLPIRLTYN